MTEWTNEDEAATTVCRYTWPLLDPNPEDVALGNTHRCCHLATHDLPHRCACGEVSPKADYGALVKLVRQAAFDAWFDVTGGIEQDTDDQAAASEYATAVERRFRTLSPGSRP